MADTTQGQSSPSPQQLFYPKHLSVEYLRYLDTLVGNAKATNGGYATIELELRPGALGHGKAEHTWVRTGHKAGYQY